MPKKKNNYKIPDDLFIEAIENSISIRGALLKLGLCGTGSAYRIFKRRIEKLNIDTSHLLGKAHLTGRENVHHPKQKIENILVENSTYLSSNHLKQRLIREKLLDNKCSNEKCNVSDTWNGEALVLQLDHINGINNDNRLENLRLLCPNCHSQTSTFAGKNIGGTRGT